MSKLESEFVGAGGTFYVMAQLAFEGFHACLTFGNARNVDIVVSSADGRRAVSIQVKAARSALRHRGRGEARTAHHLEWTLGRKAAKVSHEGFFFAFVDLRGLSRDRVPDIYFVPAPVVAAHCEGWVDTAKWVRFHASVEMMQEYKNNWQPLRAALAGPVQVVAPNQALQQTAGA